MPRGRKRTSAANSPLSSLASASLSPDVRERLADAGLSSLEIAKIRNEADALAILALRGDDNPAEYAPACFRRDYSPDRPLCSGCVFAAQCWTGDNRYLKRVKAGKATRPNAPDHVIDSVLAKVSRRPPAPRKRQPPKPRARQ